jgi:hypothetical protein
MVQNDMYGPVCGHYGVLYIAYGCKLDRWENNLLGAHPQQLRNMQSNIERVQFVGMPRRQT